MPGSTISSDVRDTLWASEIAMGNPFQVPPADWAAAADFMGRHEHDVGELSIELCERRMPDAARRLLLGMGNWWAFSHEERVIHPVVDALASVHGREIGISKVDLLRVLSAADRFYEKIDLFVGASPAVQQIRIDAWKACFGATLDRTLTLAKTINDQNVLIVGEAGTGKEILASAIQLGHLGSPAGALPTCQPSTEPPSLRSSPSPNCSDTRKAHLQAPQAIEAAKSPTPTTEPCSSMK